ncbi:MAG TPA: KpsF/GutQ family sugar-phosphate isomerase, partial [Nitrospiria bacterium]
MKRRIAETAKNVLRLEAKAIGDLVDRVDSTFFKAVEALSRCQGRVVVTGMGKSGLIGKKTASTLASTGTPAFFLHPAEGIHGDLGMVSRDDTVIMISNSGETEELTKLLPVFKRLGVFLISLTGNASSTMAKNSDLVIDVSVREEAGPLGLIPTSSTTAALAMGDALSIALLEERGFKAEDFAFSHPGGSLGKKLLLGIEDVWHTGDDIPRVKETTLLGDVIMEMTSKKFGMTTVLSPGSRLSGIITDGDLRRLLKESPNPMKVKARDIMSRKPKTIGKGELA